METTEIIRLFQEFIEKDYHKNLLDCAGSDDQPLIINYSDLMKFSPDLADELLERPGEAIKGAEIAIEKFDLPIEIKKIRIRFFNLPKSSHIPISNVRAKHIDKLIAIEGLVKQKSPVKIDTPCARFECPSCGNIIPMLQLDVNFREPTRCGCGRKGKFRLLSTDLVDFQGMNIEESSDSLDSNRQPNRINVILKEDLVKPLTEKRTNPGSKVRIIGVLKTAPIYAQGAKTTKSDFYIDANMIEPMVEDYSSIKITDQDKKEIEELASKKDLFDIMVRSILPGTKGHDKIKVALFLQMLGGVPKKGNEGNNKRSETHILLMGDPGSGKSQILKRIAAVTPGAIYTMGTGNSGAGLTAAVIKDEFLKGYTAEAGALVLANGSICIIDEIDKMSKDDRNKTHEAMEQQTVTLHKGNVHATLIAETTILAAGNPKFGRIDPYEPIQKQIDLPASLISRYDLIFIIRDLPNMQKDEELGHFILGAHRNHGVKREDLLSTDFIRKYISYAKQKKPALTDEVEEELVRYFSKLRNKSVDEEGKIKAIPLTPRQLEGLIRMSEASAKARLSDKVEKQDSDRAIELLEFSLSQVGIDPETGEVDIDRISSDTCASDRNHMYLIKKIINELIADTGSKKVIIQDIIERAEQRNISEKAAVSAIEKVKKTGDIIESPPGFIYKVI